MVVTMRVLFACWIALLAPMTLFAQTSVDDKPKPFTPPHPATRAELDHAEALTLEGLGRIHERENRLLEAVKCYEEARRLDPESASPARSLAPLYVALDRLDDALAACQRVLELEPDDYETGYLYGRQLRALRRPREAVAALSRAAASRELKDRPGLRARILNDVADLHEAAGNWSEAEASLRAVAAELERGELLLEEGDSTAEEIASQAGEVYEKLGRLCLKAGKPAAAVAAFDDARRRDPSRANRLAYTEAQVLAEAGRPAEALRRVDDYLSTQPQGLEAYELKIGLLKKLGRAGDVVAEIRKAATADALNSKLQLLLAREYRHAGMMQEAEAICNKEISGGAGAEAYRVLFGVFEDQAEAGADRVLRMLNQAVLQADPPAERKGAKATPDETQAANARAMLVVLRENPTLVGALLRSAHRALLQRQNLGYKTRVLLASLAERTKQLDAAEELYRNCLRQSDAAADVEQDVYAGLLQVLSAAHRHQAVVEVCKEGLEKARDTNRVLFYLELAQAEMALDHGKEALAAADESVKLANVGALLLCQRERIAVLSYLGRHTEAIASCQVLLREYTSAGDVRDIRYLLASVYTAAKEHEKSEEQLKAILREDPDDATANNDLGYQWADQSRNLAAAERMIRKAIELDKQQRTGGKSVGLDADRANAAYLDSLGWVLFRRGDLAGARRELETASTLPGGDDDPVVWDHLGDVLFKQGDVVGARRSWQKCVTLFESTERRRRPDERYEEVKQKLRQQESATPRAGR